MNPDNRYHGNDPALIFTHCINSKDHFVTDLLFSMSKRLLPYASSSSMLPRLLGILLFICFCGPYSSAQQGTIQDELSIQSEIMDKQIKYSVYLPPDYSISNRHYPVVYLLHGYGGNEITWFQFYEMNRLMDQAINSGEIPPMIVIMPDGEKSWFIDSADGKVKWESMFLTELMPQLEKKYRIREGKRTRGIAGLSMGGFGALTLGMRHTDLFAAVGALSAEVFDNNKDITRREQAQYDRMFAPTFGKPGLEGEERFTEHIRVHAPIYIATNADVEKLKSVRYWIDCGDDDFLSVKNGVFHAVLLEREIPHEYRVRDGGHRGDYWHSGLIPALAFIGKSFRGFTD